MRFRHLAIILIVAVGILSGGQFRIAKITIKERSGARTVFRVFRPGSNTDVIATKVFEMTDRDFMCHLYDWYGFRERDGGFGLARE